jgi:Flp pilus assembly protein TadB
MSPIFSFEWLSSVLAAAVVLNIAFYGVTTWSSRRGNGSEARKAERDARVRRASHDDRYHAALARVVAAEQTQATLLLVMAASTAVMTIVAALGLKSPTKPALLGAAVVLFMLLISSWRLAAAARAEQELRDADELHAQARREIGASSQEQPGGE